MSGDFRMYWDYYEKNGKQYTRIYKSTMDFKVGKAFFNFKNLFNGDKALGKKSTRIDFWLGVRTRDNI